MRHCLSLVILLACLSGCATSPRPSEVSSDCDALNRLTPAARKELLALAAILEKNPRYALDFTRVGKYAFSVGHDTMVTFAADPAATTEDIIFFVPAKGLIRAGLDVTKFETVPPAGQMVSGKWYYSSGRDPEPRFNNNALGTPVLMMAVDSDAR